MRTILPVLLAVLAITPAAAQEPAAVPEGPAAPVETPAAPPESRGAGYVAPGTIGSVADMNAFANEFWDARFDLTKAAKVDNLILEKDAGRFTLTGWVFAKAPVRGITSRVIFFGEGRFEMTAPIAMEKQQFKRFLGTESVDQPVDRVRFDFNGADEQRAFDALAYTAEAAVEAREKSDKARAWLGEVEKVYGKVRSPEEDASRKLEEYAYAADVYRRFINPRIEGNMQAQMEVKRPKDGEKNASTLVELWFGYDIDDPEEVGLAGRFDHGNFKPWSQIASFACCGKYAGGLDWAATSTLLETQSKESVGMAKDTLRLRFEPGGKRDVYMTSTMDLVVLQDGLTLLELSVTPYMGVTKCWIDGKESGFVQPEIPGGGWLHVPGIGLALPRAYRKGEHVEVRLELEGKILANLDGSTWVVKDEDRWFPSANQGLGNMATVYDTTLIVPKGFTAITNGAETPCEGEVPADHECARLVTNVGIDWAMFNIGRSMKIDRGQAVDGTPIAVYTCKDAKREFAFQNPDNPALVERRSYSMSDTGASIVNLARLAHATYEDWFGDDPYNRLYLTPHPKGHGRGSASLLLLAQEAFLSSTNQSEWASLTGGTYQPWRTPAFIAHEIAHQWWGGAAGIRSGRDQWFSEGFADYGCNIVMENYDIVNGTNWKQAQLAEWMGYLTKDSGYANDLVPLALGNRHSSSENRRGYENYRQQFMYSKGAFVMQMLRTVARAKTSDKNAGDALFKTTIKDFMTACKGKHPSNLDLMNHFTTSYGMKLEWFFRQWVYGMGIPKIEFSYQMVPAADGKGYMLRGRVKQKDTAFIIPVSISFHQKGQKGDAPFYYQWVMKADETFEKGPIPFKPDKVTINDDQGLLAIVTPVPWEGSAAGQ